MVRCLPVEVGHGIAVMKVSRPQWQYIDEHVRDEYVFVCRCVEVLSLDVVFMIVVLPRGSFPSFLSRCRRQGASVVRQGGGGLSGDGIQGDAIIASCLLICWEVALPAKEVSDEVLVGTLEATWWAEEVSEGLVPSKGLEATAPGEGRWERGILLVF